MQLSTHLSFGGNCAEAFAFYQSILGGDIPFRLTIGESPMAGEFPPSAHGRIMHMRLVTRDGQTLMGADCMADNYTKPTGFCVSLGVDTPEEAARIYTAFAEGGDVFMPLAETFWARAFGMVTDKFGTPWMINCEKPM